MRLLELLAFTHDDGGIDPRRPDRQAKRAPLWTRERLLSSTAVLIVAVAMLCLLGLVMVFSASSIEEVDAGGTPYGEFLTQVFFMILAYAAFIVLTRTRGTFWTGNVAIVAMWVVTVLLLVAVLAAGSESHGATRWLSLGPVGIQPSEFAKITLVAVCARLFADWDLGKMGGGKLMAMLAVFVLFPLVLILAQKDLGTIVIIGTTLILLGILSGVRITVILTIVVLAAAAVIFLIVNSGYRSQRLRIWLNPGADYYGDGWQLSHSLFAFGSGGFFGTGLGSSAQKYSYLPEAHNDFIFAIIGEELGFIGALAVIALFLVIGWAGMRIASAARERHLASSLLVSGLTCSILVQTLLNMCGVLQILPLTGRPIPFVSAGGSSILSSMIMVGLIVAVARDNEDFEGSALQNRQQRRSRLTVIEGGARGGVAGSYR